MIRKSIENGHLILFVEDGYIDLSNSTKFRKYLDGTNDTNIKSLILDLTNVTYVDSTGLGALTNFHQGIQSRQNLSIVNANEQLGTTLRVTKIDQVIPIFDTLQQAFDKL